MMIYEWYQQTEFANVWVLPFLLMLPVLAWLHFRTIRFRKSAVSMSTAATKYPHTLRTRLIWLPYILRLLALGCLIIALARPQIKNTQEHARGEGIDIILCMDVSGSMLSKDFLPNRLEVAKEMAMEFVKARRVDRIGLVIFSGESFTQFPLSTDRESLLQQIQGLRSGMLEDGTLIGEGLATSVQRLEAGRSPSRVVILLSDGKEEAPDTRIIDPATALGIAKLKNVKVYTIGMAGEAPVTVRENGNISQSRPVLDEQLLLRIAQQTGGQYFRAKDKEGLEEIYRLIDRLEKSEYEVVTRTRYHEEYIYFVFAALSLLLLELILRYSLFRTFP
jgi:Ca-activated chloride channel family protein